MATREETRQRREALRAHLSEAGRLARGAGRATETVRALAGRFQLSVNSVLQVQKELAQSGELRVVPRVGAFAQRGFEREGEGEKLFLMVGGPAEWFGEFNRQLSREFGDQMAILGGAAITLQWDVASALISQSALPPIAGVFDMSPRSDKTQGQTKWSEGRPSDAWARVRFANHLDPTCDCLAFDDEGGGYAATRHLMNLGRERIAFLGLDPRQPALFEWSHQRQNGWQRALDEAGRDSLDLAFSPSDFDRIAPASNELSDEHHEIEAGRLMARDIARRGDIDAVVAANDPIAHGLLAGLQSLSVPTEQWPAIVGFDADPRFSGQFLTSLRLPWEKIGQGAADLLWARASGALRGAAQLQRVPMKLIPRLSCRTNWFHPATRSALFPNALPPL